MTLLELSPDRIAAEVREAEQRAADELIWRRRVRLLGLDCFFVYLDGLLLTMGSLHFTGVLAQVAFCSGLVMANAGPFAFAYWFWQQDNS